MTERPKKIAATDEGPVDPDALEQRQPVRPEDEGNDLLETDELLDPDEIEQRIDVLGDDDDYDR